jgi:LysR family cys regulon transcriptional activator
MRRSSNARSRGRLHFQTLHIDYRISWLGCLNLRHTVDGAVAPTDDHGFIQLDRRAEAVMNFQQLRVIRETVRHNYNLTEAAQALFTSQSGLSRHIKELEDEVGVELFVRRGKRLVGLTDPGKELLHIIDRVLLGASNIKRLAERFSSVDHGTLTIATTHTQARYALPKAITEFRKAFPNVQLVLHQGSSSEIVAQLLDGAADIGIATEGLDKVPALAVFPYQTWHHAVVVPADHPLARAKSITLAALAKWPIITYSDGLTGRRRIDAAFASANVEPQIVMSALDSDVIKAYVELGLGIGIVAAMAYDPVKDGALSLIKCEHLFEANQSRIAVRHGSYMRGYAYRFIELCSPALTESTTRQALKSEVPGERREAGASASRLAAKVAEQRLQ